MTEEMTEKQMASISASTRKCMQELETDTMTREEFRREYPGMIMVRTFDLKRVEQLKNVSVDEGLKFLAIWKKQFEQERERCIFKSVSELGINLFARVYKS